MLVLKRKVGETIIIGDDIQIQVLSVDGETIKLGFVAPKEVQIMRSELYMSLREENIRASKQLVDPGQLLHLLDKHLKGS